MKLNTYLLMFVLMLSLTSQATPNSCRNFFAINNPKFSTRLTRVTSSKLLVTLTDIAFAQVKPEGDFYPTPSTARSKVSLYSISVDTVSSHRLGSATLGFGIQWRNASGNGLNPLWELADRAYLYLKPRPTMTTEDKIDLQRIGYQNLENGYRHEIFSGEVILADSSRRQLLVKVIQTNASSKNKRSHKWKNTGYVVIRLQ